jgi:GTPase
VTDLPVVAVVGRPNVGKSSLVNRVIGGREAIVEASPGVTRDRQGFSAEWAGRLFEIVDTGGLEPGAGEGMRDQVARQARLAMDIADAVVFVVDAQTGLHADDLAIAQELRPFTKPVVVAANKVDDATMEGEVASFYRLGLGDPCPVSALHGRNSGDLLDRVVALLPDEGEAQDDVWASVAIVGRPNVGKSSLVNALLGDYRAIVDATPGTTRDPVDSLLDIPDGRRLRLVDTAGMRRRVKIDDPIEYFSWLRSRRTLARVDVAVLVVDASSGVTSHDQRIAQEIVDSGRACVVALNKWDLTSDEEGDRSRLEREVVLRLRFLPWATTARTSALTSRGIGRLLPAIEGAVASHRRRLGTSEVNRMVRDAQERRPHPRSGGRSVRVLYAVQAGVSPPTFVLFTNARLETGYVRYLENQVRATEPFGGSPVILKQRVRKPATGAAGSGRR